MSLIIFLILLATVWYLIDKYFFSHWKRLGFKQLEPTFFVGNTGKLLVGAASFFDTFNELYNKSKRERFIGYYNFYKPAILINDPKLIHNVFIRDFNHFHDHSTSFDLEFDSLSGHLFSLTGQKWRDLRVKLSPGFTSNKLRWMFPVMKECSNQLIKHIDGNLNNNENIIVINELFKRYGSNVISSVGFGIDNDCISDPKNDFFIYGNKFFEASLGNMLRTFLFIFMPQYMRILRVKFAPEEVDAFFKKMVKEVVEYREQNNFHRNDFMDLLLQLKNQGYMSADKNEYIDDEDAENLKNISNSDTTLQKLTLEELTAQAFVFFLAAFETNSAPMTFIILELARDAKMQRKVQEEIDQVFSTQGVTYESLKNLKYLNACLLESLRKYPPVPVLSRECTKDYVIPGTDLVISKGSDIKIPIMSIQRNPDIYDEPLKFKPERFFDSPTGNSKMDGEKGALFYAPFGEGPRHCIGMRMAKVNAILILSAVLSKYKFSLVNEKLYHEEVKFDPKSFPLMPLGKIEVKVEKR